MRVPRFYINPIAESSISTIDDIHQFKHITKALRMGIGSELELFDGLGTQVRAIIQSISRNQIEYKIVSKDTTHKTNERNISAIVPVIKREAFVFMVQKLTEVGIEKILIYRSELEDQTARKKKDFAWDDYARDIASRACEQSGNNFLPICEITENLQKALEFSHASFEDGVFVSLDPNADSSIFDIGNHVNQALSVVSGPESGFSDNELNILKANDVIPCSLGSNILRAETAPIVAVFALMR
jgi:16S rRNA (uracil1498-N3)-methyltransferase